VFSILAGCGGSPEPTGRASSTVSGAIVHIDWSMPNTFGNDFDGDGLIDLNAIAPADPSISPVVSSIPGTLVRPSAWKVVLDGCASTPAQSYQWWVNLPSGWQFFDGGSSCSYPIQVPAQGDYTVALVLGFSDGTSTGGAATISVKNYLVASMGDSVASGEGNPDVQSSSNPVWSDTRCHRSTLAGPVRAALALEESDPHSSVTFVSVACSGAGITKGLINGYDGEQPPPGSNDLLPPQIQQVGTMTCPPGTPSSPPCAPIDALLLTIGGNDADFSGAVHFCAIPHQTCSDDELPDLTFVEDYSNKVAAVYGLYPQLDAQIHAALPVKQIYFGEYQDLMHDDSGNYCGDIDLPNAVVDEFTSIPIPGFTDGDINNAEIVWAHDSMLVPLNENALAAAQTLGWKYIGGIARDFGTHGYCANDHWIVQYDESKLFQGTNKGTMHPNSAGHDAIAQHIAAALEADTTLPQTLVSAVPQPDSTDLRVFVRGLDNAFYVNRYDGAAWGGWDDLGGQFGAAPAAIAPSYDQVQVFGIDKSGRLESRTFVVENWAWNDWQSYTQASTLHDPVSNAIVSVRLVGSPTVVQRPDTGIDVFARGADGGLWHLSIQATAYWGGQLVGGYYGVWEPIGAPSVVSDPSVVANGPNRLDIVVVGLDHTVWHGWESLNVYDGGDWHWESLQGYAYGNPKLVAWGPNRLDIFAVGRDHSLNHDFYDSTGGGWGRWESLGSTMTGDPGVVSWQPGRLDIFARGPGDTLWHQWFQGGWGTWEQLGGAPFGSGITAISSGPGNLDAFGLFPDQSVATKSFRNAWLPMTGLGGVVH
jgi:hypothetical protein